MHTMHLLSPHSLSSSVRHFLHTIRTQVLHCSSSLAIFEQIMHLSMEYVLEIRIRKQLMLHHTLYVKLRRNIMINCGNCNRELAFSDYRKETHDGKDCCRFCAGPCYTCGKLFFKLDGNGSDDGQWYCTKCLKKQI